MDEKVDFRLVLDFEKTQKMYVKYKKESAQNWQNCMEITRLRDYVDHRKAYLEIFATMGRKFTFGVSLYEMRVFEKFHRLDIDERLAVNHEIVQEIFDKVIYFTEELNENKDELRTIFDIYHAVYQKSKILEVYVRDLYKGTKRFEEHVLDNMRKYKDINPKNIPKIIKIGDIVSKLERKQSEIYNRFKSIRGILTARNIFQNMKTSLQKMEGTVILLNDQIGTDAYQTFFGKANSVVDFLKRMDFREMVEKV